MFSFVIIPTYRSVTVSSIAGIPENDGDGKDLSHITKRRASAAAIMDFSYDENGDPCSAV